MIKAKGISKAFGKHQVLGDVSLEAEKGEWLCFYGKSGCGKTTLISILAGLLQPDSGMIELISEKKGFAFQDDRLLEWRSAEENLIFVILSYYSRGVAEKKAEYWLKRLGLSECRNRKPGQLSGGMRRRLNIARSLSIEPDILFLDEPFAFLDTDNIEIIRDCVKEAVSLRQTTVLMVSHPLEELAGIKYRLIDLDGRGKPLVLNL